MEEDGKSSLHYLFFVHAQKISDGSPEGRWPSGQVQGGALAA